MNTLNNNRDIRTQIAKVTLNILEQGFYTNAAGDKIVIQAPVESAIRGSKLYSPDSLPGVKQEAAAGLALTRRAVPTIEVTDESTLAAAKRLVQIQGVENTVCLNFASAKNPGGGFLGGSQAQEESLARSSALYPCISQMEEMYSHNRSLKTCLYSDYMIYSPQVPVFRHDSGELLERPYLVSMITAPAVNAGIVLERELEHVERIKPVMLERIRNILSVAAHHGERALVLGAYGCGVFRNNPGDVAAMFRQVLVNEHYGRLFDRIVFAVLDKSEGQKILNVFKRELL
ncbi:MAG: hypothetical protein K0R57_4727 [Paenibacillaceae bacterium]|jgi:uncharacterized protein (TIGR02452 family)|nr:hypothetical protein [Paenibacillaceae bacterium]